MRGTTLAAALIALSIPAVRQAKAQAASPDTTAATTPGAERAAGELLHVMHLDDQWPALVAAQMDQVITNNPQMGPFKGTMTAFFIKYAGWQAMEPAMQHMYAQQFTEADLRNMIAFYSTPTGQKATSKLAVLQARGAEIGQQAVAAHKDELTAAIMLRAQQIKDSSQGTPTVWTKPSP